MDRRIFIKTGVFGAGAFFGLSPLSVQGIFADELPRRLYKPFKMKFSPRLGMAPFSSMGGSEPLKKIRFLYEQGFTAFEGAAEYKKTPVELQKAIGALSKELKMDVGSISALNEKSCASMTANFVPGRKDYADATALNDYLAEQLELVFACLRNINAKTFIIGPGLEDKNLSWQKQYENSVGHLKFCAKICERAGMTMHIEPLNLKSHPGQFCNNAALGAKLVRDVGSPNCRMLFDIFHEQMQAGNLDSLDAVWNEIGAFHVADAPQRLEPGTGIIDYRKVFKKIWDKGYRGFIGLEHGVSKRDAATDAKMLAVYRSFDAEAV